jgi:hypothetical protein
MPVMPGGNFVPQSVLQGGTGQSVMPTAMGTGTPNQAGAVNAQPSAGPGQGGAATAQTAEAQLPAAQQAAGMQPAQPQQGQPAPPQPGQPPAQPPAPPAPQPGFVPNSQGQQVYMPGQGPVTEKVPPLADMANQPVAAEPRGHMDVPLDANAQAGQMELMASAQDEETDPFDLLGQMFQAYYDGTARKKTAYSVPAGLLAGQTALESVKVAKAGGPNPQRPRGETGGLLCLAPTEALTKLAGGNSFDVSRLKERRDPDDTSNMPWDVAERDRGDRDDDDDDVEDPSDLEEQGDDDTDPYIPPRHEAVPYDDNGKPRPSWKEAMEYMAQLGKREYTPGEDCAHCGASMEKGEGGKCNTCGHDYDSGKAAEQMWCARCHEKWEDCGCPGKDKVSSVIGTHGVPMVSTGGDMQRTSAGEGDVSSLLVAPWTQNGADAWRDLHQHQGRSGGKGKTTFGGLLSDSLDTMSGMNPVEKKAMDDCYANAYNCGEGCECAKAKKEKAAFEILPDGTTRLSADDMEIFNSGGTVRIEKMAKVHPFRPLNAEPDFIAANKEWFEAERAKIAARRKRAMIGDDGSFAADPFGGGMILGQQQQQENPMDNPGTLLEAGLGDNQGGDTTAQPSDHGQHDATVAPFSNGIDVNVFKEGSFGWGFVRQCQAQGLTPEFIFLAAEKSAALSETIAAELEPLTKQAVGAWLAKGLQFGKSLLPMADDAARYVSKAPKGPGWGAAQQAAKARVVNIPQGAGWGGAGVRAQNVINQGRNMAGSVASQGRNAYNAAYGARSPAYQMGARMAVGGGAGTVADVNEAYSSGSYEPTFMLSGLMGGMRPGGLGRTATGAGLGYTADMMTGNQYGFTQMGAMGGAGSNFLPKRGLLGAARELTSPKSFSRLYGGGGPLAKDPLVRGGQMMGAGLAAGEIGGTLAYGSGQANGIQQATGYIDQSLDQVTKSTGIPIRDYMGQGPDGSPAFNGEKLMEDLYAKGKGQMLDQLQNDPAALNEFINAGAQAMPELLPIAEQLGAVDPATGQIDAQKLRAGMANFSSGGGMSQQLDKMGMGWAKPLIDFAVSNPIGMAVIGGGVLMLLGGLMGGGSGMGLLGAGAMALGAFGGVDGMAQQFMGGGQQQQQQGPPAVGPPPDQSLGQPTADQAVQMQQAQETATVNPQQVATGQAPPQGFDAGAALQNLLPQVQQILPDVTSEEIMGMMTQLGENADQVFDMQPEELAATIQALRQRGG